MLYEREGKCFLQGVMVSSECANIKRVQRALVQFVEWMIFKIIKAQSAVIFGRRYFTIFSPRGNAWGSF